MHDAHAGPNAQHAQHALTRLSLAFGMAWVAIAMVAAPGPTAWVTLSGDPADAGLFFALFGLASAIGAFAGGRALERWGHGALVGAHALSGVGFLGAGVAYARGSLPAFIAATALLAAGLGAVALTRIAAAGLFPPAERGRAVARVTVSATVGAVLGPFLLLALPALGNAIGRPADGLVWFVAPPLLLASAILASTAHAPGPTTARRREAAHNAEPHIPRRPLLAAVLALVCAQGAMVSVMGVTGVHLAHTQSQLVSSITMAGHFVGMFAFSLLVGRFADKRGRRPSILVGATLLAAGGLCVAFVPGPLGLAAGLLLVGVGWSFAYIGGTTLLADAVPGERRARVAGGVDFFTALLSAFASFAAGRWYAQEGITGLGLAAVALVTIPLVAAFSLPRPTRAPQSH